MNLRRSRNISAVLLGTLALTCGAVTVPSAGAAGSACSNLNSYFAGAVTPPAVSIFGSQARIEYNNPDLCGPDDTSPSASVAWVMISAPSVDFSDPSYGSNFERAYGWAQVGYGQFGTPYSNPGIGTFAQWTLKCKSHLTCASGASTVKTVIDGTNPTGSYTYSTYWEDSDGFIHMKVGVKTLSVTTYDPAGDWVGSWDSEYNGETKHPQTDVPGVASDVTSFDQMKISNSIGTFSFVTSPLLLDADARYHVVEYSPAGGGKGIRIWTDPQ